MKKEFKILFQINKMVLFEVSYYILGNNNNPYFTTSAMRFIRSKRGYCMCGQCQKNVLEGKSLKFFNKYEYLHLKDLTTEEYNNIIEDIQELKENYNYIEVVRDTFKGSYYDFGFSQEKELSMLKAKQPKIGVV